MRIRTSRSGSIVHPASAAARRAPAEVRCRLPERRPSAFVAGCFLRPVDGLPRIGGSHRVGEVPGQVPRRHPRPASVPGFESATHLSVEPSPPGEAQLVVEGLAEEVVGEPELFSGLGPDHAGLLGRVEARGPRPPARRQRCSGRQAGAGCPAHWRHPGCVDCRPAASRGVERVPPSRPSATGPPRPGTVSRAHGRTGGARRFGCAGRGPPCERASGGRSSRRAPRRPRRPAPRGGCDQRAIRVRPAASSSPDRARRAGKPRRSSAEPPRARQTTWSSRSRVEESAHWRSSSTIATCWSAVTRSSQRTAASSSRNRRRSGSSVDSGAGPSSRTRVASRSRSSPTGRDGGLPADGPGEVVECLHPGPEAGGPLTRPAGSPTHQRRAAGRGVERSPDQRRLAHPGLAADEDGRTTARRRGRTSCSSRARGSARPMIVAPSGRVIAALPAEASRSPDPIWRKASVSGASRMTPRDDQRRTDDLRPDPVQGHHPPAVGGLRRGLERAGRRLLETWLGPATERMLDAGRRQSGSRVLDVAAGAGGQGIAAARRVGPDGRSWPPTSRPRSWSTRHGRSRGGGVDNVATLEARRRSGSTSFAAGTFDAAISRVGLIYFPDRSRHCPGSAMRCVTGGRFATVDYSTPRPQRVLLGAGVDHPASAPSSPRRRRDNPARSASADPDVLDAELAHAGFHDIDGGGSSTRRSGLPRPPSASGSSASPSVPCTRCSAAPGGRRPGPCGTRSRRRSPQFETDDGFVGPCELVVAAATR